MSALAKVVYRIPPPRGNWSGPASKCSLVSFTFIEEDFTLVKCPLTDSWSSGLAARHTPLGVPSARFTTQPRAADRVPSRYRRRSRGCTRPAITPVGPPTPTFCPLMITLVAAQRGNAVGGARSCLARGRSSGLASSMSEPWSGSVMAQQPSFESGASRRAKNHLPRTTPHERQAAARPPKRDGQTRIAPNRAPRT